MADEQQKTGGALAAFAKKEGAVVSREARAAALARTKEKRGSGGGGDVEFLTFSGMGKNYKGWSIGREREAPDPETLYAVGADSIVLGYTCWMNGKPVKKHRWGMYDIDNEMGWNDLDHSLADGATDGDGWKEMIGFAMVSLDDPEKPIVFETTSASGVNSVRDLLEEISAQVADGEADTPIIRLSDTSFEAHGKTNGKPVFEVEGWSTEEEVKAYVNDADGDPEDLLNGNYATAEEEPEQEEEPVAEKPKRRRRKAA